MKLCKDCRYMSLGEFASWVDGADPRRMEQLWSIAECHHEYARRVGPRSPVTGERRAYWQHCALYREPSWRDDDITCGPHGRYWEPKQPPEPVGFVEDDPKPGSDGATTEPK